MAYVGYAGQANPQTGTQGAVRSQVDPGYQAGTQTPQYNAGTGGIDPFLQQQQTLNSLYGLYGPQMTLSNALGQQSIDALTGETMLGQASLQNQMQQAQQGAYFQQAGLGLQGQNLGIQQAALGRQVGELPQQYGLQQQGFGLQEQGLQANAATQRANLDAQMGAQGAYTSIGANRQRGEIQGALQRGMQGVGIQRQGAAINYMEQTAQMQDAKKELGIQSQQLGLNQQEVTSRLNNALAQMGLQGQINSDQLLAETSKIKQGMISPLSGLISMIGQVTNLPLLAGGGQ